MNINYKRTTYIFATAFMLSLLVTAAVLAGANLDSPGGPTDGGSQMYTLEQIYNRLDAGTAGTKMTAFTEPVSGPGSTMHTLDEIMAAAPALDNTNGATTSNVLAGQTFWGLTAGQWATQTGTMPNNGAGSTIVPTTTDQSVAAGYWSSANTVEGDADLVAGNIAQGVNLFGVDGSGILASGNATAGQVLNGITFSNSSGAATGTMPNNGAGSTIVPTTTNQSVAAGYWSSANTVQGDSDLVAGNIAQGVNLFGVDGTLSTAPCDCSGGTLNGTRWCDNGDGTVTDLLGDSTNNNVGQCLVWLKNANCSANLAGINKTGTLSWDDAMVWSSAVSNGNCGLSDGSSGYEWRMPTLAELDGITNGTDQVRSSSMRAFTNVQSSYWSGTLYAADNAWLVNLSNGAIHTHTLFTLHVWPVRGGQ